MDSSSDEEYDYSAMDVMVYNEFIDGSSDDDMFEDGDEEAAMSMMSIQEELEKKEEHVLNFRGSIKGRITVAVTGSKALEISITIISTV